MEALRLRLSLVLFSSSIEMGNTQYRQVSEPTSQTVIRGPKDSFVESLSTNQSLIRRRIRNKNLHFEEFIIGNETKTKINLVYVKGIANEEIIEEIRTRLNKINVSAIFESANIEELIADKTFTVFPLALNTERPDTVAGNIMEGKIGIIVDGSPFVLLLPTVFTDFFVSSEDYYHNFFVSSFIRILRYISFMIVLLTPAAYVGLLTYNQEMLPTNLLISIAAQREGVPFPAVVEVFIMEFTFEILREAGIRMPRAVGHNGFHCRCSCCWSGSCTSWAHIKHYGHYCGDHGYGKFCCTCVQFIVSDKNVTIYPYYHFCLFWPIWNSTWINCYGCPFSFVTIIWCALFSSSCSV